MKNTYDQLCALFSEWAARMQKDGIDRFTKDGVHYHHPDVHERYKVWNSAKTRILFIANEMRHNPLDQAEDWSSGTWGKINNYTRIQYLYMQRVLKKEVTDFNPTDNVYTEFLDQTPFCWINVKKATGGPTAVSNEIRTHIDSYGDLLLKEVGILRPTDIVCLCGGNNGAVIEKLKQLTFQPRIYTAYHPAAFRVSREKKYNSLTLIQ